MEVKLHTHHELSFQMEASIEISAQVALSIRYEAGLDIQQVWS
jgi:hypothetical protein